MSKDEIWKVSIEASSWNRGEAEVIETKYSVKLTEDYTTQAAAILAEEKHPSVEKIVMRLDRWYFNTRAYFDKKGALCKRWYNQNDPDNSYEGVFFSKQELEQLNRDDGQEVVGDKKTAYYTGTRYSNEYSSGIGTDTEWAYKPDLDYAYQNPRQVDPRVVPFTVILSKNGNPVVDITTECEHYFDENCNYSAKIRKGVITPEVALQDGYPGLMLRNLLLNIIDPQHGPMRDTEKKRRKKKCTPTPVKEEDETEYDYDMVIWTDDVITLRGEVYKIWERMVQRVEINHTKQGVVDAQTSQYLIIPGIEGVVVDTGNTFPMWDVDFIKLCFEDGEWRNVDLGSI